MEVLAGAVVQLDLLMRGGERGHVIDGLAGAEGDQLTVTDASGSLT